MQAQRKRRHHSGHSQSAFPETPSTEGAKVDLFKIAIAMKKSGIPDTFVVRAVRAALDYEGIFDLMKLWEDETEISERSESQRECCTLFLEPPGFIHGECVSST